MDYYWDANGATAGTGGAGTWNTGASLTWRTGSAGGNFDLNGNGSWGAGLHGTDRAVFGGTAGIVGLQDATTLYVNSLWFQVGGYTLNSGTGSSQLTLTGTNPTITTDTGTTTIGAVLSGSAGLSKAGAGTLVLNGANTYSGTTTVTAGTLRLGAADRLLNTSALNVNGGIFDLGAFSEQLGAVTLTSGSITGTTGVLTGTSFDLQSGSASVILSGTVSVKKSTSGTVILSGANTYTGATNIDAGVLNLQSAGALGTAANTSATTVANGATLLLSGGITPTNVGTLFLSGSGSGAGSGALQGSGANNTWNGSLTLAADATISSAGNTLYLGSTTANQAYLASHPLTIGSRTLTIDGPGNTWANVDAGVAGDTGGLIKNGTGKLTFYGYNTYYTGPTTVNAGSLDLVVGPFSTGWYGVNGPLTIGVGPSTPASAGTVVVNILTNSYANQISPTSAVAINSDGTLNVGAATSAGSLTLNGGKVSMGTGIAFTPTGAITANANTAHLTSSITGGSLGLAAGGTTFNVASDSTLTSDLTVASPVTGTGTLTKTGAGILTLSGANTYTGATAVNAGTLRLTGSLANSAIAVNSGGIFMGTGTATGTLAVNSGGTLAPGDNTVGRLTTGAQTWYGGGTYAWQISNATGAAGAGYDSLTINGTLTIASSSASKFNVQLNSVGLVNFADKTSYNWTLAHTTGGIVGFDTTDFGLNAAGFNAGTYTGSFSINTVGNDLVLSYTAIPEPRVYATVFGLCTLGFVGFRRWRSRGGLRGAQT